jgi:C-terminal processing protease CtpA/Prc
MRRGPIIGMPSGGSTGQPWMFDLPGGGTARICVKRDSYPDGTSFVGTGIIPDIQVPLTVRDIRAGSDAALEHAAHALTTSA